MKKIVFTFGRMNPPTIGHQKLVDKIISTAKKEKADAKVFLSHSQNNKKDPLNYAEKIRFARKAFGKVIQQSNSKTIIQILKEYYSSYQRISNTEEILHAPLKVALYHPVSGEHNIYPAVKGYDKVLQVKISGDYWVDLSHKEANKGVALQKLLDHYNIDRSEILVFGDYLNDIEMLRMTPNSVAMGNAHPEIKAMASIVTESHDNFGVERVLQELLKH